MTHICVSKLTIIGSDNGLSPGRRQAIIWTNAGILLILTLGTNFSEILSEIRAFSFKKMHLKMSSAKWRRFCLGLNVLTLILRMRVFISSGVSSPTQICCTSDTCMALTESGVSIQTPITCCYRLCILQTNLIHWLLGDLDVVLAIFSLASLNGIFRSC